MKKFIVIMLVVLSFSSYAQTFRLVDWKFKVENVVYVNDSTWIVDAIPYDYNDPGADTRTVGNYVRDYINRTYEIIAYDATTLTLVDLYYDGIPTSPQQDQTARCYLSLNGGDKLFGSAGATNDFQANLSTQWFAQSENDEWLARAIQTKQDTMPFDYVLLKTDYTPTEAEPTGTAYWDSENDTWSFVTEHNIYQLGQELAPLMKNVSGGTMYNGQVAYYAGAVGSSANIQFTSAALDGSFLPSRILGILTEDVAANEWGKVTWFGGIRNFNIDNVKQSTDGPWAVDDILYASTTEASRMTNVMPDAPYYVAEMAVILSINGANITVMARPTWNWKLTDLADVNGTPLTTKGQFPVWDGSVFDFNYNLWPDIVSNEAYDATTWDGKDSTAASQNAIRDKIEQLTPRDYCPTTTTVGRGTITGGTVDSLCAKDGQNLTVQELTGIDPLRITFTFTSVERMNYFIFYGQYNGGASHVLYAEIYNPNTANWEYLGTFGLDTNPQWHSFPIYQPDTYISGGSVQCRIVHQGNGVASHELILDYVDVNFGGGGGGGTPISAGEVSFMPYDFVAGTNVQSGMQQIVDKVSENTDSIIANELRIEQNETDIANLQDSALLSSEVTLGQDFFRSGTTPVVNGDNTITFETPFPDNDYVAFTFSSYSNRKQDLIVSNKTIDGFTVNDVIGASELSYLAVRRADSLALLVNNLTEIVNDITGADGLKYSNDTLYLLAGDSILDFEVIQGGSGSTAFRYDKTLSLNENTIDIGTDITQATLVFVNGYAYPNYTYLGTEITLGGTIQANDYLTVAQTGDTPLYNYLLIDSETVISLPFTATPKSLIFYNGLILQPPQYSGSVTLSLDVNENDNLIVKQ